MSARIEEIRQENRSGDVSWRDIEWLCSVADAAERVLRAYTAEAEDWNDGEFALWKKDDLIMAIVNLRSHLAATEEQYKVDPDGMAAWEAEAEEGVRRLENMRPSAPDGAE